MLVTLLALVRLVLPLLCVSDRRVKMSFPDFEARGSHAMSKTCLGTFFWSEAARKTSDVMYTGELAGVQTVYDRYLAGRPSLF